VLIRKFTASDWPEVWPIVREIVQAQQTFAYDPGLTAEQAYGTWIEASPGLTVVAVADGRIAGTAKMGPNQAGPGSHVSTASFMVAADSRGRGVGTSLCRFAVFPGPSRIPRWVVSVCMSCTASSRANPSREL
jgi:predicted N-acetyltransferase YhbS